MWEKRRFGLVVAFAGMAERFTTPGTANVNAADRAKLAPLLKHYGKMAHPFTACFRDQIMHGLSKDHAARRCAVLKDLIRGTTKWRKGGKKHLSVAELREIVELSDASGMDCEPLRELRRMLNMAERSEAIEMARKREPSEDSPDFNWRKHGNRRRGVILKNGKRAIVSPQQFDRLKKAKQIDESKTPKLKGDSPVATRSEAKASAAESGKSQAKPKEQLVNKRITKGPRKGQVVQGRIGPDGKWHEIRKNTSGNVRSGQKFEVHKDKKGRKVHVYNIGSKRVAVVVKPKRKAAKA